MVHCVHAGIMRHHRHRGWMGVVQSPSLGDAVLRIPVSSITHDIRWAISHTVWWTIIVTHGVFPCQPQKKVTHSHIIMVYFVLAAKSWISRKYVSCKKRHLAFHMTWQLTMNVIPTFSWCGMHTLIHRVVNFPEIYYFRKFPEILAKAWKI